MESEFRLKSNFTQRIDIRCINSGVWHSCQVVLDTFNLGKVSKQNDYTRV